MKKTAYPMVLTSLVLALFLLDSCATARYLETVPAPPEELTGTYTLILYGARYSNDIENVAVLASERGPYEFEVYAPDFDYRVKRHVPAKDAIDEAQNFVRHHYAFMQSQLTRIVGPSGNAIGYEVRPLYYPLDFGFSDVLDVYYFLEDGKVVVRIRIKPEIERALSGDDRPFLFRRR